MLSDSLRIQMFLEQMVKAIKYLFPGWEISVSVKHKTSGEEFKPVTLDAADIPLRVACKITGVSQGPPHSPMADRDGDIVDPKGMTMPVVKGGTFEHITGRHAFVIKGQWARWWDKHLTSLETQFVGKPPNPDYGWVELWDRVNTDYDKHGVAYLWTVPNVYQRTCEVLHIPADDVTVNNHTNRLVTKGDSPGYMVQIPMENVLVIPGSLRVENVAMKYPKQPEYKPEYKAEYKAGTLPTRQWKGDELLPEKPTEATDLTKEEVSKALTKIVKPVLPVKKQYWEQ